MKKMLTIATICCALVLAMGLVACGGSSSGSAASGSAASNSAASGSGSAASSSGDAKAALDEGIGYWFGSGPNGYDKEKARAAFQQAADKGSAEGWYWLGAVRQIDTDADRWPQVIECYQKAADNGCAKGWYGLGRLYETGYGVEKDVAKATELFEKAVNAGELLGNVGLGYLHQKGEGVEANGSKAAELFEKAAASDDWTTRNEARIRLGSLHATGGEGLKADGTKSQEYCQAAIDDNYGYAWGSLGNLYYNGTIGAGEDFDKSFECFNKAADYGRWYNLGMAYNLGKGCEADHAKAIELFNKEIAGGKESAYAMGGMAYMAAKGSGMDQDLGVATDWCNKALAAAGPDSEGAAEYANRLLSQLANSSKESGQAS